MGITSEAFRKKLSRARKKLKNFLEGNCGRVDPKNKCRCINKIQMVLNNNKTSSKDLLFADKEEVKTVMKEIDELDAVSQIFLTNPYYKTPQNIIDEIKKIINSKEFQLSINNSSGFISLFSLNSENSNYYNQNG